MNLEQYGKRLDAANHEWAKVRGQLPVMGQCLAERLYGDYGPLTLRDAAKRLGLGPTYLSQVKRGLCCVSPAAFAKMLRLYREVS
jgi:hypothetical protein